MKLELKSNLRVYDLLCDVETTLVPHKDVDGVVDYIDMYIKTDGETYLEERFMPIGQEELIDMISGDDEWLLLDSTLKEISDILDDDGDDEEDEENEEDEEGLMSLYNRLMECIEKQK